MIKVNIKKPLYGNMVYIRDSILRNAIFKGENIELKIPSGTKIIDPRVWLNSGKRMQKVFNFPDRPMILYGNYVNFTEGLKKELQDYEDEKSIIKQHKLI